MKKLTIIFLMSFMSLQLFGQNKKVEIARQMCECINNKSLDQLNYNQYTNEIGLCLIEIVAQDTELMAEIANDSDLPMDQAYKEFAKEIGMLAGFECPQIFLNVQRLQNGIPEPLEMKLIETGQITGVDKNQFNSILLKTSDGSLLKFLWLDRFEGDQVLMNKDFKNKNFTVQYEEKKLFDSKKNAYISYKVITKLISL